MSVMIRLQEAIRETLREPEASLDAVDLHRVAKILQPLFPHHSVCQIAREVAHVAVQDGYRYLIWEPPAE